MRYEIPELTRWRRNFAWLPTRIGPFWVWFEPYDVRAVSMDESWSLYPPLEFSPFAGWLDEFRYAEKSYWRLSRCISFSVDRTWVVVKPKLKLVVA